MPAISKKQFVILAIIVILITIVIIALIVSERNSSAIINNNANNTNNENNSINNQIPSQDINNSDDIIPNISENGNDEIDIVEENLNNNETDINTQPQDMLLLQIQKRIEVLTNRNSDLIFKDMFTLTSGEVEKYIGVDISMFDSYIVRMSSNKFSSELYMIFKPFEQNKDDAKAQIKKFLLSYESAWFKLNDEQYELVKNRTAVERNGYIIYIISTNNNTIMSEIRNYI